MTFSVDVLAVDRPLLFQLPLLLVRYCHWYFKLLPLAFTAKVAVSLSFTDLLLGCEVMLTPPVYFSVTVFE